MFHVYLDKEARKILSFLFLGRKQQCRTNKTQGEFMTNVMRNFRWLRRHSFEMFMQMQITSPLSSLHLFPINLYQLQLPWKVLGQKEPINTTNTRSKFLAEQDNMDKCNSTSLREPNGIRWENLNS